MKSAGELELEMRSIVGWGDISVVTFNATKTKLLSRYPLFVPVKMNGRVTRRDLFLFAWLELYSIYGLEAIYTVHCQGCFKGSGLPL